MRKHALHLTRIAAGLALTVSTTAAAGVLVPSPALAATTSTAAATANVNLRTGPGTSYSIITLIPAGATVTVTGAKTGSWLPVIYNGQAGYAYASYLEAAAATTYSSVLPATIGKKITTTSVNVRSTGYLSGAILTTLPANTVVAITGATTASYSQVVINGRAGWIYTSYLGAYSAPATTTTASTLGQKAANYALAQVGKDYAYGQTGPDAFDCSGLVVAAYRSVGITVPYSHAGQASFGTSVSRSDLRPGDVLALGSSMQAMAIYVGNDTIVIADGPDYGVRTDNLTNRLKWEPLYTARRYA